MRELGTLTTQKTQSHPTPSLPKVMRSYQVVLKCANQTQREEINRRIISLEKRQENLITSQTVKKALKLYRDNPKEGFFTQKLGKSVGTKPNIAESAYNWVLLHARNVVN